MKAGTFEGLARRALAQALATLALTAHAATGTDAQPAAEPRSAQARALPDGLVDQFDEPEAADAGSADRVAHHDLARLLEEGEAAYRGRRREAALVAFQRAVTIAPDQAFAWLRLGNLHHQRGDAFKALAAYRRAASRGSGEGTDPALRAKALYNLALINLDLAQQTLRTLERIGPPATTAGPREPLAAAVQAARRRLEAFAGFGERGTPAEGANRPDTGPTQPAATKGAPAPRAGAARTGAARPGAPRRGAAAGEGGEAELPRVDYIRGAPR